MANGTGTPTTSVATASGVGVRAPTSSRVLPAASASIAHARIIKGDRNPDNARYFHEIIKEQP